MTEYRGDEYCDHCQHQAARIERLENALRPFAEFRAAQDTSLPANMVMTMGSTLAARQITVADFRRARAALELP